MMSEKRFTDVAETPKEELECKKKYLYEYSMFWECNDGSKCQILEDDVCDLVNEQQATIQSLKEENKQLKCINDQLEERLENSGIGVALKMDCDN